MTGQDYAFVIGAIAAAVVTIVGVLSPFVLNVIKALKENTAVTVANTADRAVKTAATNEALTEIKDQTRAILAGTGTGTGTVVVMQQPTPTDQATPAPAETPAP